MYAKTSSATGDWAGPAKAAFEFWVSFWPTAPLFGVSWRFADLAATWSPFAGTTSDPAHAPAPVRAKLKARAKAAPKPAARIEIQTAPTPAETAATETAPAAPAPVETAPIEAAPTETGAPVVPQSLLVTAPADPDDLTAIKGIGPGLARQLNALGVYKLSQIADFTKDELRWIDDNLSSFRGRCFRDDWIGQAKVLIG